MTGTLVSTSVLLVTWLASLQQGLQIATLVGYIALFLCFVRYVRTHASAVLSD